MLPIKFKKQEVSVLIHATGSAPVAFRLQLESVRVFIVVFTLLIVGLITGTLFFFRELETNRKLREALLDAKLKERVLALASEPRKSVATEIAVPIPERPLASVAESASPTVKAKVSELNTECLAGKCGLRLVLVPAAPGSVEGSLVVVLETEIPRIGTANSTSSVQKRFFIYPGYHAKDEIDLKQVNLLEAKPFKMSRALTTNIDFQFGDLLRPFAVNVFIFDVNKTLVLHERRQVEISD